MYRFSQKGDYDEWIAHFDSDPHNPWTFAEEHKASRVTVLAISNDPDIEDQAKIEYQGPLYFDIDSDNLDSALRSGVELCEKLYSLGALQDDVEIHLSGSKGVHVFVDQRVFSNGRKDKGLPTTYKNMAIDLYVPGLDTVVYSLGKGRMFRPANARRPDGAYKVRVTYKELKDLNAVSYKEMVKKPRDREFPAGKHKPCTKLSQMFLACSGNKETTTYNKNPVPDERLQTLEGKVPQCLKDLAEGKEKETGQAFNQIAMNIACFTARAKDTPSAVLESLLQRAADNLTSKKYDSSLSRLRHMQGMDHYVKSNLEKYKFSCASVLSCVSTKPCPQCPVKQGTVGEDQPNLLVDVGNLFVHEHMGQYYRDAALERLIATFTMTRDSMVVDEGTDRAETSQVTVMTPYSKNPHTLTHFDEEGWSSKTKFKEQISGIEGVVFMGDDNDVSRIKMTLRRNSLLGDEEVRKIIKATKTGIHWMSMSDDVEVRKGVMVYVEPGYSINSKGVLDTHVLAGSPVNYPSFKTKEFECPVSPKANEVFNLVQGINKPEVVSTLLGWYLAAHLKTHVYGLYGRFPILCVSGVAGTGKNATVGLLQRLSGLTGETALNTLEAPNSTKLPFQQALTDSATIPRVINELNPKSVSRAQYSTITEMLKAAFDSQTIQKGRLGGGDKHGANVSVVSWRITAPVVTLSEEPIAVPAVLQRAITVKLDPVGHNHGSESFYEIEFQADCLLSLAVALTNQALHTKFEDVIKIMKETVLPDSVQSSELPERLKFGYKVILAAYEWAIQRLPKQGLSEENVDMLIDLRQEFIQHISENVSTLTKEASINEVDKVLNDLAVMAYMHSDPSATATLENGRHYSVEGRRLFIDIQVCYPILQRFKTSSAEPLGLKTANAFISSCRGLKYFISANSVPKHLPTHGRPVVELDIDKMLEANIPVTMFTGE